MEADGIVAVSGDRVACDGGGALGHPRVFLHLGADGAVDCPYCGQRFVREPAAPECLGG